MSAKLVANPFKTKALAWNYIKSVVAMNKLKESQLKYHHQTEVIYRVANALKYAAKIGCTKTSLTAIINALIEKLELGLCEIKSAVIKAARRKALRKDLDYPLVDAAKNKDQAAIAAYTEVFDGVDEEAEEDDDTCDDEAPDSDDEAPAPTPAPSRKTRSATRVPAAVIVEEEEDAGAPSEVEELEERKVPVRRVKAPLPAAKPVAGKIVGKGKVVVVQKQVQDDNGDFEARMEARLQASEDRMMAMFERMAMRKMTPREDNLEAAFEGLAIGKTSLDQTDSMSIRMEPNPAA